MTKQIRKAAVKMHLKRSSWEQVKMAWKVSFLMDEYNYRKAHAARKAERKYPYRASVAFKQHEKFKLFAEKGVKPEEVWHYNGGRTGFI